jgi:hypothetical protein
MRLQDFEALMRVKGAHSAFLTLTQDEVSDTCFVEIQQIEDIAKHQVAAQTQQPCWDKQYLKQYQTL